MTVAVVALHPRGLKLARTLARALPDATVHAPRALAAPRERPFKSLKPRLCELFEAGTPIVGVMASGILVRVLAPLLKEKRTEPAVIAVSEDGRFAVPLVGGHRGANRLAEKIARTLGGRAAITT